MFVDLGGGQSAVGIQPGQIIFEHTLNIERATDSDSGTDVPRGPGPSSRSRCGNDPAKQTNSPKDRFMRKVVVYMLVSLDGVAEEPGDWMTDFGESIFRNLGRVIGSQFDDPAGPWHLRLLGRILAR